MEKIGGLLETDHFISPDVGQQKRYSEIRKAIPAITEKMLIQHFKQMQEDNLVLREMKAVVPPVVIYSLSPSGEALTPVLEAMVAWAFKDNSRHN